MLTHSVRGVRIGRENRPSGGHYCKRIYTEIGKTLEAGEEVHPAILTGLLFFVG